jgi:hypothetical protein
MPTGVAKQNEHDKGETAHGIAVETPACRLRHQRIESDIGRHEPEIDDGMQRHREEHARQPGVHLDGQSEYARQHDPDHFEFNTARRPGPKHCRGRDCEHCERHRLARIVALPSGHVDDIINTTQIIESPMSRVAPQ